MPRLPRILAFSALVLPLVGCADAPITPAQIQADGQLRAGLQQSEFQNLDRTPPRQTAQSLQLTAVLAAQAEGALEDSNRFLAGDEATVYLHLRADKLDEPRPVRFTWTHPGAEGRELTDESMGFLMPSETLARAVSHALPAEEAGTWTLRVHGVSPFGTDPLLFERTFEVVADAEG